MSAVMIQAVPTGAIAVSVGPFTVGVGHPPSPSPPPSLPRLCLNQPAARPAMHHPLPSGSPLARNLPAIGPARPPNQAQTRNPTRNCETADWGPDPVAHQTTNWLDPLAFPNKHTLAEMVTSILQGSHKALLDDEVPLQLAPADVCRLFSAYSFLESPYFSPPPERYGSGVGGTWKCHERCMTAAFCDSCKLHGKGVGGAWELRWRCVCVAWQRRWDVLRRRGNGVGGAVSLVLSLGTGIALILKLGKKRPK